MASGLPLPAPAPESKSDPSPPAPLMQRLRQQLGRLKPQVPPPALQEPPEPLPLPRMSGWRPRSLSALMLVGLLVIAVPLLWAVITAAIEMRTLTTTGQKLVMEGATAARSTQELATQVAALERRTRFYDLLRKPNVLELYRSQVQHLHALRAQLSSRSTGPAQATLAALGKEQLALDALVQEMSRDPALTHPEQSLTQHPGELDAAFNRIWALVDESTKQTNDEIDSALATLKARADRARTRVILQSALLIPLTVLAIFGFTMVIGRPLRHLDRAISDLGEKKNLSKPIEVPGPVDLELLGQRLEWLRMRMLDLDNERSRFMRHMSHELKTPLAAIADGTELLMDGTVGTLDPNQQEIMEILREKSKSLQEMIDNLLSFTAWQTSRVGLMPGEFGLRPLIKQVIENHRIMILRQRIRLDLRIEDITLVADRSKFRLIVENLVSNALKYSPKGGTIHIKARKDSAQLVMDIADHGPGIAVDERAHIFDAFFTGRAAKARKSSLRGTGIGLSVVLEFVSAHQGKIEIIDGEYPGAHFRVTMPIHIEGDDIPGQEKAPAHAA